MSGYVTVSNHMKKAVEQSVDTVSLRHMTARPRYGRWRRSTAYGYRIHRTFSFLFTPSTQPHITRRCADTETNEPRTGSEEQRNVPSFEEPSWRCTAIFRQITENTNLRAGRVLNPEVVQYESSGTRLNAVNVLPCTYWCAQCARSPCRAAVCPPDRLLVCRARTAKSWCGTFPGDSCCSCNTNNTCQQAMAARPSGKVGRWALKKVGW